MLSLVIIFFQTDTEYMEKYATYKRTKHSNSKEFVPPVKSGYPESMDWRTKGAVTSVKSQVSIL